MLKRAVVAGPLFIALSALADPRNDAGIRSKVDAVKAAELALANARSAAFAKVQCATVPHIVNGQLMAAFVDGDPNSSNNWLKKVN